MLDGRKIRIYVAEREETFKITKANSVRRLCAPVGPFVTHLEGLIIAENSSLRWIFLEFVVYVKWQIRFGNFL